MNDIWDTTADEVHEGDNLRQINDLTDKSTMDENGFKHYIFSKIMFNNPVYTIPKQDMNLFNKFLNGGSRMYPSDGNIPTDIVAKETRAILKEIEMISKDTTHHLYQDARDALKSGRFSLVRGTMKLYIGKYTTRDWRRKRFTDDIDFWIHKVTLLEAVLKKKGWKRNKQTKEWEKVVSWENPFSNTVESSVLIASNDLNQGLDFGAGSYLDGSSIKDILKKKVMRGHDVDISDIINVAMVFNKPSGECVSFWKDSWGAFEENANTRNKRIISNIITLCRHSYAISNHLNRVGKVLIRNHYIIFDCIIYPDSRIRKICRVSTHWQRYLKTHGYDITRELIHDFIFEQGHLKRYYSKNLKAFTEKLLELLNLKLKYNKIIIEFED